MTPSTLASSTSELISSLGGYLWPLLVGVVLWRLFPVIREILSSRSYTINVAGFSMNVQDASNNLHEQIADLQREVARLTTVAAVDEPVATASSAGTGPVGPGTLAVPVPTTTGQAATRPPQGSRILWVDDKPENNAYEIQTLNDSGVDVVTATSTVDGLRRFGDGGYFAVITDFGRVEDGGYRESAGKDLLEALRKRDKTVPIYVFTTGRLARDRGPELIQAGATGVTGSSVRLLSSLGVVGAANQA